MRTPAIPLVALAVVLLLAAPARAEKPDPVLAFLAGATPAFAGFAVGGVLLGTSNDSAAANRAGWLVMEGGFALAPLAAHGVAGEWGRGVLFAAAPTAMFASTAGLFAYSPNAVGHGTLEVQRVLWAFFGVGVFSSAVGVVDAAFAPERQARRTLYLTPTAGIGGAGLTLEGTL
jgi:hypothetical protein